jgi:hypothetical protein
VSKQIPHGIILYAVLHLGYRNPKHQYVFGNQNIPSVSSMRDLGVVMTDNMKFHEHIENIYPKQQLEPLYLSKNVLYTKTQNFL